MSASPITPLDYIAAGYWRDFLAGRSIAGGMAYETELQRCKLDETLASLQRIDTLLSQIRRDMIKAGTWDEAALLADERHRNFMVFLAFYAGRVLAQQWQHTPHWFGEFELRKRYPALPILTDDFYQHMAVIYRDDSKVDAKHNMPSLFFALEPIGLRLFGHIDRLFKSVQGSQVASGLYQAVSARLPNAVNNHESSVSAAVESANKEALETVAPKHNGKDTQANADVINKNYDREPQTAPSAQTTAVETAPVNLKQIEPKPAIKPAIKPLIKEVPTPELFSQLLTELREIEVPQTAGRTEYEQACKVLDQFEQHIAKQDKPRAQIKFSQKHLAAKQQALAKLQEAANAGNSTAMLRLAMYELLDEGLATLATDSTAGTASGVEWVQQAASKNDSRAQRLLSKMYYQGFGVPQDMTNGKYWLEQAAQNGHTEAASLISQWQQAQALISTQKQEQHSIKRYQLLFAVIIAVAILIFIIV